MAEVVDYSQLAKSRKKWEQAAKQNHMEILTKWGANKCPQNTTLSFGASPVKLVGFTEAIRNDRAFIQWEKRNG